ncbi:conserved hypothetical protein [Ricinus communis]|uniref:Vacuolar iron transporter n=1 Tax=Ricinus communis TaxID=3988 RepID=B9SRB4_RICCO|nr:conserved hypothetical protein [Ricinus communis]|eukprot:XP_002528533.1 vacuolar iron transporter homolog 3 [Ricinus communis]
MMFPRISQTCAEQKIAEADDNYQKAKRLERAQWLRAAILGASDGLLSTTSLMLGVGAAEENGRSMVLTGVAGGLAGACSMAVGEFVSVSTQRDIEKATVSRHNSEHGEYASTIKLDIIATPASIEKDTKLGETNLAANPLENIQHINFLSEPREKGSPSIVVEPTLPLSVTPGRSPILKILKEDAREVSGMLQEDNREVLIANPYKAAAASAVSFLFGSSVPLVPAILVTHNASRIMVIVVVASMALVLFGGYGAYLGGSPIRMSAVRVLVGGWIAMAVTYGLLKPFDSDDEDP